MEKRYKHDCTTCIFLGQYKEYDLYYCPQGNTPTVLARYGNEGEQYSSGIGFTLAPLVVAEKQARDLGYLK